jgi:hypothetical protein
MTSKKPLLSALGLFFLVSAAFAQNPSLPNPTECEKIVEAAVEAINTQTPESLEGYLAPDFSFSGQNPQVSKMLFTQLVRQLGDEVTEYTKTGESTLDGESTLVYEFVYARMGAKTSTFVFDAGGKLKRMDLFTLMVKRLDKEATRVEKSDREVIEIPIEIRENLPLVKADIEGRSRWFFFDSGAPNLILNRKYYKSETDSLPRIGGGVQGVNSSVGNLDIVHIGEFDMGGVRVTDSDVLTMDMSHLEEIFGVEIHGLVGYAVFKDYDLLFDYDGGTVTLIAPEASAGYLANRYPQSATREVAIEMRGHIPVMNARIGETQLRLGFDCGAGGNLLDENLRSSLGRQVSRVKKTELSGAGESRDVESAKIRELVIGGRKFRNTRAVFNDIAHLNAANDVTIDGLVGYEILSRQKVLVSFRNRCLCFID